jgi:hypothetical protein
MKKVILIVLFGSILPNATFAQNITINKKVKYYYTWVYQEKGTTPVKGFLYELKDTSIVVLNKYIARNQEIKPEYLTEIPIKNIEKVKTRNKKSIQTGVFVGLIGSFGIGYLAGSLAYEPDNSDSKSRQRQERSGNGFITGISLTPIGVGIGLIAGTAKASYEINNNWNDYMLNANSMLKKSIKYQLQN